MIGDEDQGRTGAMPGRLEQAAELLHEIIPPRTSMSKQLSCFEKPADPKFPGS